MNWRSFSLGAALLVLAACSPGPAVKALPGPTAAPGYVQVAGGRFTLDGHPFVLRGANYSGSWRTTRPDISPDAVEQVSIWSLYHEWNAAGIDQDMRQLRRDLNATTLRIALPSREEFETEVKDHGYAPWFRADGSITPEYARKLVELADIAQRNGLRLQLCLLWNFKNELLKDADGFRPGGAADAFYANQVRSVAALLAAKPSVMAYSIGNEVLVRWEVNGRQHSWYEPKAAAFILRRLRDVRQAAPHQLLTTDEGVAKGAGTWHAPSASLAQIADEDGANGGQPLRLADFVDYVGGHFYPRKLTPETASGPGFDNLVAQTLETERTFLRKAESTGKPVVLNEFGVPIAPQELVAGDYRNAQDELFSKMLSEAQRDGAQGVLVWHPLPTLVLRPGYAVRESTLNKRYPVELDVGSNRITAYRPAFDIIAWPASGEEPQPTKEADELAAAWPGE